MLSPEPIAAEGRLRTSYSRIGTYEDCHLKYFFGSVAGLDDRSSYQMAFGRLMHTIFELAAKGEKMALGILTNMVLSYVGKYPTREVLAAAEMMARLWAKTGDVTGRCKFAGVLMHRADDLAKDDADRASHYRWWGVSEMLDLVNENLQDGNNPLKPVHCCGHFR